MIISVNDMRLGKLLNILLNNTFEAHFNEEISFCDQTIRSLSNNLLEQVHYTYQTVLKQKQNVSKYKPLKINENHFYSIEFQWSNEWCSNGVLSNGSLMVV